MTTASEIGVPSAGQVARAALLLGPAGTTGRPIAAELAAAACRSGWLNAAAAALRTPRPALAADGATTDVRTVDVGDAASLAEAILGVGWSCQRSGRSPGERAR